MRVVAGGGAFGFGWAPKLSIWSSGWSVRLFELDTRGVIYQGRKEGMTPQKQEFAVETSKRTLADALDGADVFVGLSQAGLVTQDMVKKMAPDPIVFGRQDYEEGRRETEPGARGRGSSTRPAIPRR